MLTSRFAAGAAIVALALAGCGGGTTTDAEPDTTLAAPTAQAGDNDAQRRAIAAQTPGAATGPAPTPTELADALEASTGMALEATPGEGYTVLTLVSADADGMPLPEADAALAKYGSFTLTVSDDDRKLVDVGGLGDLVPND